MPIRAVIADDHRLILAGLRTALGEADGIEVVGEATSGDEAVRTVARTRPDVVLLDLRMPHGDGFWALGEIRRSTPETRVIMLSVVDDPERVNDALAAGAASYIVKTIDPADLSAAIRQTVAGNVFAALGGGFVATGTSVRAALQPTPPRLITDRELEILQHVAEGLSNSQIGKRLWVTEQTVKFHLSNIYRKLGVANRTEASRYALRHGLLRLDDEPLVPAKAS